MGGVLFIALFLEKDWTLAAVVGILSPLALVYLTIIISSSVTISDTEITSKHIFSEKTLDWREIQQVFGSEAGIKLKNFNGDVTVSISSHIPGYEEIIERVGEKRPDLFTLPEFNVMKRSQAVALLPVFVILAVLGLSGYLTLQDDSPWILYFMFAVVIVSFGVAYLVSPKSVALEGNTLLIQYPFKETVWRADEIEAVQLKYHNTRHGKSFFVNLFLTSKKSVKISSLGPGVFVMYLVLKEWHKRQTAHKLSV
jgi:hypothetical protein